MHKNYELAKQPGWVWALVQWLGSLMPVSGLLMHLGLSLSEHLLSDEKFATLRGERIYLFLVSQGELIGCLFPAASTSPRKFWGRTHFAQTFEYSQR